MTLVQVLSLCVLLNFRYSSKYSAQIYRAQYGPVWSRHVGVPPWNTNMAAGKLCKHLELTLAI